MFNENDIKFTADVESEYKGTAERSWRNAELASADIIINILFDENESTELWQVYRKELREYPNSINFPDGYRPTKPS
jgi:hypothetical protein